MIWDVLPTSTQTRETILVLVATVHALPARVEQTLRAPAAQLENIFSPTLPEATAWHRAQP